MRLLLFMCFTATLFMSANLSASVIVYGTEDCLTTGCYGAADPTAGATLSGLAAGANSSATTSYGHGYPFSPTAGDFPGTDQIYVGATQTTSHDGYSSYSGRIPGPLVLTLNYSSAVPAGQTVQGLTLGLALDDFQQPVFGDPYTVSIDGVTNSAITSFVNGVNETGPVVQFFTFGLDPSVDNSTHTITVSIAEGGDGGDGFAVDFATLGVTTSGTSTIPEPPTNTAAGVAMMSLVTGRYAAKRFGRAGR